MLPLCLVLNVDHADNKTLRRSQSRLEGAQSTRGNAKFKIQLPVAATKLQRLKRHSKHSQNHSNHDQKTSSCKCPFFCTPQVSTAALHAQPAPHKRATIIQFIPSHTTDHSLWAQYTCSPPRDARNTGEKRRKVYDRHIFQPSSNMQKGAERLQGVSERRV